MMVKPERAQKIVAACCMLHNYLITENRNAYIPAGFLDSYLDNGTFVEGNWREIVPDHSLFYSDLENQSSRRESKEATEIRNHLCSYVNSPDGSLAWQNKSIHL
jgi:hypothetical protein